MFNCLRLFYLFLFFLIISLYCYGAPQFYDASCKEDLRIFLRQGDNFARLGLSISDTLVWQSSELWVGKINSYSDSLSGISFDLKWLQSGNFLRLDSVIFRGGLLGSLQLSSPVLSYLDCSYNRLEVLDVSLNVGLLKLLCNNNILRELTVGSIPSLDWLDCSNNCLLLSGLPLLSISYYNYLDQHIINLGERLFTDSLDLRSEYIINGDTSDYTWYDYPFMDAIYPVNVGGIFLFSLDDVGKRLICRVSNINFPLLVLEYEMLLSFELASSDFSAHSLSDKEDLRVFLRQDSNFAKLGLSISDTLSWDTSSIWIDNLSCIIWRLDDSFSFHLYVLGFNSLDLGGSLQLSSPFLRTLNISDNNISFLDVSNNIGLAYLDCSNNNLSILDISYNRIFAPGEVLDVRTDEEFGDENVIISLHLNGELVNDVVEINLNDIKDDLIELCHITDEKETVIIVED